MSGHIGKRPNFELPEELGRLVDVKAEEDKNIVEFAKKRKVLMLAIIASYVPVKVSPIHSTYAQIGVSEEFGIETALSKMHEFAPKNGCDTYVLINSPGGLIPSSYEIAKALRDECKKLTIFVPHIAASGGTLMALTGDKIFMGKFSRLSPMDVQIGYGDNDVVSANAMLRSFAAVTNYFKDKSVLEAPYPWKALADKLDPVIMQTWTDIQEGARQYVSEILKRSNYKESDDIARKLVFEYMYHSIVIDFPEAKKLGLRVFRDSEDREAWNIMRNWLAKYLLKSANTHFIRYINPFGNVNTKSDKKETKGRHK